MAQYKGYKAEIKQDNNPPLLKGQVMDITDVVVFEAETLEQAEQEFQKSIDTYLMFCKKIGKRPEGSFKP
jgi:predicted HicB family RNase H-like nuclease